MFITHFLVLTLKVFQNRDYRQKMRINVMILIIMIWKKFKKYSLHTESYLPYDEHEFMVEKASITNIDNEIFIHMPFSDPNDFVSLHRLTIIQHFLD